MSLTRRYLRWAAWFVMALLVLQLLVQLWGILKYSNAARRARPTEAHVERVEYAYDSSMGSSIRVATVHFYLLSQPQHSLNTFSFSCPDRCAVDVLLDRLKVDSLDQLVGKDRPVYLFEDGEVHLHLLSSLEMWRLARLGLLFKLVQVIGIGVIGGLFRKDGDRPTMVATAGGQGSVPG